MNSESTVILAAIEPSAASEPVIQTATLRSRVFAGAELHFVHVVNPGPGLHDTPIPMSDLVADGRSYLDRVVSETASATTSPVEGHLEIGSPVERILELADELSADLLIVGTHHKTGLSRLFGSVSAKVLKRAPCPVLVARVKGDVAPIPEIEPPCPACLEVRRATQSETMWCAEHARRHVHGHLHYNIAPGFGGGAMFIRPE